MLDLRSNDKDFDFAVGALAQLGERYTGSVEVSGSSPLCSTIFPFNISLLFFYFINLKRTHNNTIINSLPVCCDFFAKSVKNLFDFNM